MHKLLPSAEYARYRGVSRQAVFRWRQRGNVIVDPVTNLIDVEESDRLLAERPERIQGGWTSGPPVKPEK